MYTIVSLEGSFIDFINQQYGAIFLGFLKHPSNVFLGATDSFAEQVGTSFDMQRFVDLFRQPARIGAFASTRRAE